jgi:hypothetical protein
MAVAAALAGAARTAVVEEEEVEDGAGAGAGGQVGTNIVSLQHASQYTSPQLRQWWRRTNTVKEVWQLRQHDAVLSAAHRRGSVIE